MKKFISIANCIRRLSSIMKLKKNISLENRYKGGEKIVHNTLPYSSILKNEKIHKEVQSLIKYLSKIRKY